MDICFHTDIEIIKESIQIFNISKKGPIKLGPYAKVSGEVAYFSRAGLTLTSNHGLATFVHERLDWSLVDHSPEQSETEWLCVDVVGYKMILSLTTPCEL